MDKINKEHIFAGLLGGAVTLLAIYGARRFAAGAVPKKTTGMRYPPIQHP